MTLKMKSLQDRLLEIIAYKWKKCKMHIVSYINAPGSWAG